MRSIRAVALLFALGVSIYSAQPTRAQSAGEPGPRDPSKAELRRLKGLVNTMKETSKSLIVHSEIILRKCREQEERRSNIKGQLRDMGLDYDKLASQTSYEKQAAQFFYDLEAARSVLADLRADIKVYQIQVRNEKKTSEFRVADLRKERAVVLVEKGALEDKFHAESRAYAEWEDVPGNVLLLNQALVLIDQNPPGVLSAEQEYAYNRQQIHEDMITELALGIDERARLVATLDKNISDDLIGKTKDVKELKAQLAETRARLPEAEKMVRVFQKAYNKAHRRALRQSFEFSSLTGFPIPPVDEACMSKSPFFDPAFLNQ